MKIIKGGEATYDNLHSTPLGEAALRELLRRCDSVGWVNEKAEPVERKPAS